MCLGASPSLARQVDTIRALTALGHCEERHESAGEAENKCQRPPHHAAMILRPHTRIANVGQHPQSGNASVANLQLSIRLLGQGGRGAREADQCESHETTETMNDLHVMGPRVEKRKGELPCGCSPSLSDISKIWLGIQITTSCNFSVVKGCRPRGRASCTLRHRSRCMSFLSFIPMLPVS